MTRLFIFSCRQVASTCTTSGCRRHYWERSQRHSRSWLRRPTVDPPWCQVQVLSSFVVLGCFRGLALLPYSRGWMAPLQERSGRGGDGDGAGISCMQPLSQELKSGFTGLTPPCVPQMQQGCRQRLRHSWRSPLKHRHSRRATGNFDSPDAGITCSRTGAPMAAAAQLEPL